MPAKALSDHEEPETVPSGQQRDAARSYYAVIGAIKHVDVGAQVV